MSLVGIELDGLRKGFLEGKWMLMDASEGDMGTHIVKTTIEIADDLFDRAQRMAREKKTTFRALTEEGLRLVLKVEGNKKSKLPPLKTGGRGWLTEEFQNKSWQEIRDESYRGRGT
jgi:hypothetical protein